MIRQVVSVALMAASASALKLYVTSYGADGAPGTLTALDFAPNGGQPGTLKNISQQSVGTNPSWFEWYPKKDKSADRRAVIADEVWSSETAGALYSVDINLDGSISSPTNITATQAGPVATQFYNATDKVQRLAVANYAAGSIQTFNISEDGKSFTPYESFVIPWSEQNAGSHTQQRPEKRHTLVHHAILDPKGMCLAFPNLAVDRVHIYDIDKKTGNLTVGDDIGPPANLTGIFDKGDGPRHATFMTKGNNTFLFVVTELTNRVKSAKVIYGSNGKCQFQRGPNDMSTFGPADKITANITEAHAAEIAVKGDWLYVSNRIHPGDTNTTNSDTISVFQVDNDGRIEHKQLKEFKDVETIRSFEISPDGAYIAAAGQESGNVHIYARDNTSGMIGDKVGSIDKIAGCDKPTCGPTKVTWDLAT